MTESVPDLPRGGEYDVQVPCDWCEREQVQFAHPAAQVTIMPTALNMHHYRICQTCYITLAKLIAWRREAA